MARGTVVGGAARAAAAGAALAGAGRPVTTESLIDALWGEQRPDAAGNALQALRAAAVTQADPAAGHALLAEALELWRGPARHSLTSATCPSPVWPPAH